MTIQHFIHQYFQLTIINFRPNFPPLQYLQYFQHLQFLIKYHQYYLIQLPFLSFIFHCSNLLFSYLLKHSLYFYTLFEILILTFMDSNLVIIYHLIPHPLLTHQYIYFLHHYFNLPNHYLYLLHHYFFWFSHYFYFFLPSSFVDYFPTYQIFYYCSNLLDYSSFRNFLLFIHYHLHNLLTTFNHCSINYHLFFLTFFYFINSKNLLQISLFQSSKDANILLMIQETFIAI